MINPDDLDINRIIIHRVHKKRPEEEFGFAEYSENLFDFGATELETLKDRICSAFSKSKRFFKLEIARTENESFFGNSRTIKNCSRDEFLEKSKNIADLLATSHDKRTIPSGLLLIMDGFFENNKHFVLVIKAELQEAFTIKEINNQKLVELINDLFLSPAKDFYKIGYLVEDIDRESSFPNSDYSAYMYDDNFTSGKRNLAEYFYETFLGFSTSNNDKLLTKNYYTDVSNFIESNVSGFENKKGLRNALNTLFRENTTGIINPQEFAELNFDDELLRKYGSEVGVNYAHSFTKDLSLVDRRLQRGKINLIDDLKLEGPTDALDNVNVVNGQNVNFETLRLQIENGEIGQLITIKTDN